MNKVTREIYRGRVRTIRSEAHYMYNMLPQGEQYEEFAANLKLILDLANEMEAQVQGFRVKPRKKKD